MRLSKHITIWIAASVAIGVALWLGRKGGAAETAATPAGANAPAKTSDAPTSEKVAIGDKVGRFTFTDIRFLPRSLDDFGQKKAYVIAFTTIDCPVAKRYIPELRNLDLKYRDQGVQFLAVNEGRYDPLIEVANQAVEGDCEFPFAKDLDGQVARAVGATRTPEVVVLDAERRLRYRGRIDNRYRLGGEKQDGVESNLTLALDAVLAGGAVATPETPVDGCLISFAPAPAPTKVTFAEQVAPLLQKHCQDCHHAGASGPFPLMTLDDAVNHADMIAEVVSQQRMPPWYASAAHGEFINCRALSADDRKTLVDWVRGGCQPGDPAKAPPARTWPTNGWRIGEPDLVITAPKAIEIPESGYVDYQYVVLPYLFLHDTWIQKVEIRASNPTVLHHCNMAFIQFGGSYSDANFITGQVPGGETVDLRRGVGFKIPAGSVLGLQIHYVTVGKATSDQISVGLGFAKEPIQKQLKHVVAHARRFAIPPGAPHYRLDATRTLDCDATGVGMFTHMHVRGKDMTFSAIRPDGKRETLMSVPNYNFDWQMPCRWAPGAMKLPKGTKIECVAHYDNSPFNPYNPDPTKTVREGQQTTSEMMYGFFFYTDDGEHLDLAVDPATGQELPKQGDATASAAR